MSKMKHLLRKLHIGGGGGGAGGGALTDHHRPLPLDHHHHNRGTLVDPPAEEQTSTSQTTTGTNTTMTTTTATESLESSENSSLVSSINANVADSDFSLLEEEFQVQLALAISVSSDPDSREDPETTAQIKAAKQISLGCPPSQSLVDFLSLRYWSYNVVNYNEKVMDGFYDVYGINSNLVSAGKMPSLVDLESIPVLGNVDYEVILVNRAADVQLRELEEKVHLISIECQALRVGALLSFFVQKIADVVVNKMGGPVNDAEAMWRRWTARSYELRIFLNSIILPLGSLDVGLSRHRALLFKVLADRINLPCMLVKGSYYTGSDDGAVNLIRFDDGSEYIIDLMGAPGALIPSEVPSAQLQSCGLDVRTMTPIQDIVENTQVEFGGPTETLSVIQGASNVGRSSSLPSFTGIESQRNCWTASGNAQAKQFEREFGNLQSLVKTTEGSSGAAPKPSAAQQIQVEDVSNRVVSEEKDPEFARNSLSQGPHDLGEQEVIEKKQLLKREMVSEVQCQPPAYLSDHKQALIPFSGLQLSSTFPCSIDLKCSPAVLVAQKQGQPPNRSNECNPLGKLSSNTNNSGHVQVRDRTDLMIQTDDRPINVKQITTCEQFDQRTTQDQQIDPVLGEVAEWEIPWEDLQIGERIGIGSYGEVYRADWNGTEVAVKKFMNQDISGDALAQFKCEVEIMLRLRHPNVVLFMGAVTRPPNLSILTEFLPRGSLFKLLHRSNVQVDEKRRLRMALDVAKGMNYLHTSNPVIVHRDLKTPNLLVDKNWVVKVCDFGMSRMKHHTFLSSKSTAGTAEWMAPEVLRNEPSNEKSDVYSFGVILWELATHKVPWTEMNSMQVVGAVGFQGRRLTIPDRVDPVVAEIISNCWDSNQNARPSFKEIITRLKGLQRLVQKTDTETKPQQG
ncbi:probable serine/threonine-protein kinase SIS8 [Coffea eugenioides]|uniref:probable serine/threonine-protein kinase SIS8 n=1 Tax=Coffea eugenioides TaxID=49369 RepID=UPI000F60DA3B|nr:probable serine/threonine-protein kinase SIS8 [Coffea eugenioides]